MMAFVFEGFTGHFAGGFSFSNVACGDGRDTSNYPGYLGGWLNNSGEDKVIKAHVIVPQVLNGKGSSGVFPKVYGNIYTAQGYYKICESNWPIYEGWATYFVTDPIIVKNGEQFDFYLQTGNYDSSSYSGEVAIYTAGDYHAARFADRSLTQAEINANLLNTIKTKTDNLPADPAGVSNIPVSDITAIKVQTDKLGFSGSDVLATLDSEAVKLAADGMNSLVISEPTGDPSTWTTAEKLMWLIMRFMNKHTSDNYNGIVVHKSDGTALTSQAVTDVNGIKQVSKVQ